MFMVMLFWVWLSSRLGCSIWLVFIYSFIVIIWGLVFFGLILMVISVFEGVYRLWL